MEDLAGWVQMGQDGRREWAERASGLREGGEAGWDWLRKTRQAEWWAGLGVVLKSSPACPLGSGTLGLACLPDPEASA